MEGVVVFGYPLATQEKKKVCKSTTYRPFLVPRPGIEPGWIAPLVFETSASTYSAIWAKLDFLSCGCKDRGFFGNGNRDAEKMG